MAKLISFQGPGGIFWIDPEEVLYVGCDIPPWEDRLMPVIYLKGYVSPCYVRDDRIIIETGKPMEFDEIMREVIKRIQDGRSFQKTS